MLSVQTLSIAIGVVVALIFIYFLTRSKNSSKQTVNKPSLVKSFAAFFDGNDKKALEGMKELALSDKGTPEIYLSIGFLYRKLGEYTKAAQIHEILLGNNDIDDDYKALLTSELAKDYLLADMPLKAVTLLSSYPKAENDPDNLITLARGSLSLGQYDNAIYYYDKYSKTGGSELKNFQCKSMIEKALKVGDDSKIAKYIKSALSSNNSCRSARFIMAGILKDDAKHTKSLDAYKLILSDGLVRDNSDMLTIEKAFIASGQETELFKFINALVTDNAKNPFIYTYLANHYLAIDEKEQAISILEKYLEKIDIKTIIALKYAEITGNKILANISTERPAFVCSVCGKSYTEYRDDCGVCKSFDSIFAN